MYKHTLRIKLRCPRHPRYNPVTQDMTFRAGCPHCQEIWSVYLKVSSIEQAIRNDMHTPKDKLCTNPDCRKDLRAVCPTYTIKGDEKSCFCSRKCRATKTGEEVTGPLMMQPQDAAPTTATKAGLNAYPAKKAATLPSAPRREREVPAKVAPAKKSAAPVSRGPLVGKIHLIKGAKIPNFGGARKQVWELIKDGMTVEAFMNACSKNGLDGKSNLGKFLNVYHTVEVR